MSKIISNYTGKNILKKISRISGGRKSLAKKLGVPLSTVQGWFFRGTIPAKMVTNICRIINFEIEESEIRPDIFL